MGPVLAVVAFVLAIPLVVGLGAWESAAARMTELESANAALQVENASFREATGALATQVSALQAAVDDLGAEVLVDPEANRAVNRLPTPVRERAMGGASFSLASPVLSGAFQTPGSAFGVLRDILGVLEQRLALVRTGVEKRQALASATPSIWPIAGWISSAFGNRRDPFSGEANFHSGLDISADHGQQIQAPADGVVTAASDSGDYGNLITLEHGFGLSTRYGHLSRFAVMMGERVRRGQVIGYVGSTGRSTSSHLHYEVLVNGHLTNPLNLLSRR